MAMLFVLTLQCDWPIATKMNCRLINALVYTDRIHGKIQLLEVKVNSLY